MKTLSVAALGVFFVADFALAQSPADALKVGSILTFERVSRIGTNGQATDDRSTYTHKIESVADKVAVTEVGQMGTRSATAMLGFEFPIAVGKEWKHRYEVQRVSAFGQVSTYKYDGSAVVKGEEVIDIAGRPVKAYRVEISGWVNRFGGSSPYSWKYARVDWYAPSIGYVVQSEIKEIDKGRTVLDLGTRLTKLDAP